MDVGKEVKNTLSNKECLFLFLFGDMCDFDERQSELYNKMISKKGKVIANAQF